MKGFPQKNFLGIPKGWEDLGKSESWYNFRLAHYENDIHEYCHTIASIGKENGRLFKFCPKCLIKLKEPSPKEDSIN